MLSIDRRTHLSNSDNLSSGYLMIFASDAFVQCAPVFDLTLVLTLHWLARAVLTSISSMWTRLRPTARTGPILWRSSAKRPAARCTSGRCCACTRRRGRPSRHRDPGPEPATGQRRGARQSRSRTAMAERVSWFRRNATAFKFSDWNCAATAQPPVTAHCRAVQLFHSENTQHSELVSCGRTVFVDPATHR